MMLASMATAAARYTVASSQPNVKNHRRRRIASQGARLPQTMALSMASRSLSNITAAEAARTRKQERKRSCCS